MLLHNHCFSDWKVVGGFGLVEAGTRSLCDVINKNSDSEVRLSGFEFPPLPCLAVVVNMPMSQLSF